MKLEAAGIPEGGRMYRKIRQTVRDVGALAAFCYAIDRIGTGMRSRMRLHYYLLVSQPVPDRPLVPEGLGRTFEIREIRRGDAALEAMPVPRDVLASRFLQPTVCLGVFKESRLAAYLWLCLGAYDEDEVRCRFVPRHESSVCWDFDVFVFPEYRGGIAFARLWDAANEFLRRRDVAHTFSRVSAYNASSRRSHAGLGARIIGRAWFLVIRQFQLALSTLPPFVHVSLRRSSKPTIRLQADAAGRG